MIEVGKEVGAAWGLIVEKEADEYITLVGQIRGVTRMTEDVEEPRPHFARQALWKGLVVVNPRLPGGV
eukprot:9603581-Prorocentrum_lima.AAC.1